MSETQVQEFAGRLFDMAREGNLDLLAYIDHGVNIDLVNHEGQSFLMLAAYHGHAELATALARAGADVNLLNDRGQSPLAGAIFKKEDAVIDALLSAHADPTAGQPSALDSARLFGHEDLVPRLESEAGE